MGELHGLGGYVLFLLKEVVHRYHDLALEVLLRFKQLVVVCLRIILVCLLMGITLGKL